MSVVTPFRTAVLISLSLVLGFGRARYALAQDAPATPIFGSARTTAEAQETPSTPVFDIPTDGVELAPGFTVRGYFWKAKLRTSEFNVKMAMSGLAVRHTMARHVWTQVGVGLVGTREISIENVPKLTVQPAVFFGVGARLVDTRPASVDLLLQGGTAVLDTDVPMYMTMLTVQFTFR